MLPRAMLHAKCRNRLISHGSGGHPRGERTQASLATMLSVALTTIHQSCREIAVLAQNIRVSWSEACVTPAGLFLPRRGE